jgi:hypothetical protein
MAGEYKYISLEDRDDIRLLELSRGSPDDPIEVCLSRVSLHSTAIKYEAISYAWGDATECETVNTPQGTIEVPLSLHRVLRRLRYRHQARVLWADAVCINQRDKVEKSHQITIMGSIYRTASRTLFCLTDDARPPRSFVFLLLYPLIMMFLAAHKHIKGGRPTMFRPLLVEKALAQRWFTRMWVVQEYLVSENCAFIFRNYEWDADLFETVPMVRQIKPRVQQFQTDGSQGHLPNEEGG